MRFSDAYHLTRTNVDDWFDPHLTVDTPLFIDPLLVWDAGGSWRAAHEELIAHFVACYRLVAAATGPKSTSARAARALLTFPEPAEFGLGYTQVGTAGAGAGARLAARLADGIAVALAAGLSEPEHIEEVGILNEGIGADRISDATGNVLKHVFVAYTQQVAERHGVPLHRHQLRHARVDLDHARWVDEPVELPTNPATGGPVVLVPEAFLNELPTLNAGSWFAAGLNADLRLAMNIAVGRSASKAAIVAVARQHPDRVREWAAQQTSRPDLHGYDFGGDPTGLIGWDGEPAVWAAEHPLALPPAHSQADLVELVRGVLDQYRHFVEDQRGWALLHDDDGTAKHELAVQLSFLGMAQPYLRLFDVELDREVELGRGPVDFKASSGSRARLLIEMKREQNGRFWHGLEQQLPSYLHSDQCDHGWYVAVRFRSGRAADERMRALPGVVRAVSESTGRSLEFLAIDARKKTSASHLPEDSEA